MDRELDIGTRRARLWRRTGLTLGTVMAAGGLFLLSTAWLWPSVSRADIRFGRVERGDLEATVQASGRVVPAAERVLSSPVEARVVRILKEPGAILEPGSFSPAGPYSRLSMSTNGKMEAGKPLSPLHRNAFGRIWRGPVARMCSVGPAGWSREAIGRH